jgi:hypothetical protein
MNMHGMTSTDRGGLLVFGGLLSLLDAMGIISNGATFSKPALRCGRIVLSVHAHQQS